MVRIRRAIILQLFGLIVVAITLFWLSRRFPVVEILANVLDFGLQLGGALMEFAALFHGAPLQIFNGPCAHI